MLRYILGISVLHEREPAAKFFRRSSISRLKMQLQTFITIIGTLVVPAAAQMNLTQQGNVSQSSTFETGGVKYHAILAIQGPANNVWEDGCSATGGGQTAWWSLSLPKLAFFTDVKIFYRNTDTVQHRMTHFRLYLSNASKVDINSAELCYKDPGLVIPNRTQERTCSMPAQMFFFYNNRTEEKAYVEICYIEIYGCWKSTWGRNCTMPCPEKCTNQHCYPGNGSCAWGCNSLYCLDGKCNHDTSVCTTGCMKSRAGQYCTHHNVADNGIAEHNPFLPDASLAIDGDRASCVSLPTTGPNSSLHIDTRNLSVITTVYLTFGGTTHSTSNHSIYCSNTTDFLTGGIKLYNGEYPKLDIEVFVVCRYVIYLPPYDKRNTNINLCEIEIGGCPYGRYGVNCEIPCPTNCDGFCNLKTGNCLLGCLDGWIGKNCTAACSKGSFGGQCLRNCSTNCVLPPCDHVTGECKGGCEKGWEGFNCTKVCSKGHFGFDCDKSCDGCIESECDVIDGGCIDSSACKPGYVHGIYCNESCEDWNFGTDCSEQCNCLYKPCNKYDGTCDNEGCKKGWRGESCAEKCSYGTFGHNCKDVCDGCFNKTCDIFEGNCTNGCIDGFVGHMCNVPENQKSSPSNSGPAIGGGISAAIIVIITAIIAITLYRRRSPPKHESYLENNRQRSPSDENLYANHEGEQHINKGCVSDTADLYASAHKKNSRASISEVTTEIHVENGVDDEANMYNNVASVQSVNKYNILIGDLKNVIDEKKSNEGFKKEYEILPKGPVHPHNEGSKEENKLKNRFLTTWPYDHSRVVLEGDTKHDYINASYIASYYNEKAYIASQGPKKNSVRDFWHMIWQEQVGKIVMVTQLEENRRNKCAQYWPQTVNKSMVIENYRLTMKEETYHTVYVYRLITVYEKTTQRERNIHHFHFIQWPDHGVPDSINLVNFYRKVASEQHDQSGPMVVHCSAGVGRTGTFIAVNALYEHGKKVGSVDVMEYVQMMRKDRMNMIQTYEQYEVVFEALLELFTVPETSIPRDNFCGYIEQQENKRLPQNQTMYRQEFQKLQTLKPSYRPAEYSAARSRENTPKNSSKNVYPHDNYRPYLMSFGKTRNDYINAVIVPGYSAESKFLVTQCPLVETVVDFWTMVYDHSSTIVVLLDPVNKKAPLWVDEKDKLEFDQFSVVKDKSSLQCELKLSLNHKTNKERKSITVFTASEWTPNTDFPSSPEYMLDLVQRVINCWEINKGPITVVCSDGCSKSGLFVALRLAFEKMQMDDEVDVFQVVRAIQIRRPEFLSEFDQYEYCFKCIKTLLEGESRDSLYANY